MISVIVPIYNKEKYLKKCITSIIEQSYKNIEIILIDDGSTDNSLNVCKKFQNIDKRIIVISKKNMGVSAARNDGLKKAKGKYVVFIDADDWIDKDFLQKLIGYNNDLVICGYKTVDKEKIILSKTYDIEMKNSNEIKENILKREYSNLLVSPCFKLYKLEIIRNNKLSFDINMSFGEDACFVFNYIYFCKNLKFIKYNGYNNLIVDGTLSRKYISNIYEEGLMLTNNLKKFETEQNHELLKYWDFRNIKLLLYNERKSKKFSTFKNKIKSSKIEHINDNNQFNFYDKVISYLLNTHQYFILYFIYKYIR